MLDINLFRENADVVKNDLKKRDLFEKISDVDLVIDSDVKWRKIRQTIDKFKFEKNNLTNLIKKATSEEKQKFIEKSKQLNQEIKTLEEKEVKLKTQINNLLFSFPNILHESVPKGNDSTENQLIGEFGNKPKFNFKPKNHIELLELHDLADFENAAKMSGARFYFLKNEAVILEQALINFALDFIRKKGFTLTSTPLMMRKKYLEGAVPLEDFEEVIYKIQEEDLYLIGTAEHPLTALHAGDIIQEKNLPLRYAGLSNCFRMEAGSHGKDTKGIYRVHEFKKVEQYILAKPENSWKLHEELLSNAKEIWSLLEIPYRVVNICTGDMGLVAAKKYDIEAWLPERNNYGEVVSCSNCTTYQSRRSKIRFMNKENKTDFVHTLNSTVLATTRAMVAILENHQQEDGSIKIPEVLHQYTYGLKEISKK